MMRNFWSRVAVALIVTAVAITTPSLVSTALAQTPAKTPAGYTRDDVAFMQGMILHHSQALLMTAMVDERTERDDIGILAERITVSQRDEIASMRRWLLARSEKAPAEMKAADGHADHSHGAMAMPTMTGMSLAMPGMLTQDQLDELEHTRGARFDKLFLASMIQHHEGALVMVKKLFSTQGSGQEPELFRFASDVDSDQRAEIKRMQTLLDKLRASH